KHASVLLLLLGASQSHNTNSGGRIGPQLPTLLEDDVDCAACGSGSLKPGALTVKQKTLSPQGGDTLFDCRPVAKDSMAFELERCGGMNTCAPPRSENAWIPFTLSHSVALSEGPGRKEERSGERKVSDSCQSGVRGQRSARRGHVRC
ncbi:unnamed protein product, partial [Pleuronectes platessa]